MKRVSYAAGVVFAGIAAGLYAAFAGDMGKARRRLAGRSRVVSTSMGRLEYASAGDGAPVLVVHGASGGYDQSLDITGGLTERGYRLIAPSRFGYLNSEMPQEPSTAKQGDAFAELLDYLDLDRVDVIGISAGSWSAIEFAIRHPERCRSLVLLVPANHLGPQRVIRLSPLARALLASDFLVWTALKLAPLLPATMTRATLATRNHVLARASEREKARAQTLRDHVLPVSARKDGILFDLKTYFDEPAYAPHKIACPVLAVSTEDDLFRTADRARDIAAAVLDGRALIFPSGGHPLIGCYDAALEAVVTFLSGGRLDEAIAAAR